MKILSDLFSFDGRIGLAEFEENLNRIRDTISKKTKLILINGCEVELDHEIEKNRYLVHREYNEVIDKFVEARNNTFLLDIRDIVDDRCKVKDNIRHYTRDVYFALANKLTKLINTICE